MTWTRKLENTVCFTIGMKPTGKSRPRFSRKSGSVYTDAKTTKAEKEIRDAYLCKVGIPKLWDDEVMVTIYCHHQSAKSTKAAVDECADLGKPDADNIAKLVLDALNGCAWVDDSQVTSLSVYKARRHKSEGSYVKVIISFYSNRLEE